MLLSNLLLAALPIAAAAPSPWQPADSPVHALFQRQQQQAQGGAAPMDPSKYPAQLKIPSSVPQAWTDKLKSVQIADTPVAAKDPNTDNAVIYPGKPSEAELGDPKGKYCAYSVGCMRDDDIRDLPEGIFGLTFDDGPGAGTEMLSNFLEEKKMSSHATHFMIGGSIVENYTLFDLVFSRGGQIAAHTWSHPRLTNLTNEQVLGEIGWSLQVIYDRTGGRIPAFWRPPYGDLDNRVRDIASKVFGVKAVTWNSDTNDWKIPVEGKKPVEDIFEQWATGPKQVGHNTLMHEINPATVEVFISKFDSLVNNGWKIQSIAEATNSPMYLNAADNKAEVKKQDIVAATQQNTTASPSGGSGNSSSPSGGASGASPSGASPSGTSTGKAAAPSANSGALPVVPSVGALVAAAVAFLI